MSLDSLRKSLTTLANSHLHIQTPKMAELMSLADLSVTAGGSITWEKCVLGLPGIVVVLSENEKPLVEAMDAFGAQKTISLGGGASPISYAAALDSVSETDLLLMSERIREFCNGSGAELTLEILRNCK